ncbi:MAG: D-erythronate dehydrogenase [Actinomycetota bacterium]
MGATVITGGAGFLGRQLAARLLADQTDAELLLVDQVGVEDPPWGDDGRVTSIVGDVADRHFIREFISGEVTRVYHLASVVSAGAEQDFDLGYVVNLQGTIDLLERCRVVGEQTGRTIQVVFTSSCAAYGSGAGKSVDDSTALRPETSYGVQKASCELLVNDYHRKGFIDGRGLRLPTVSVRPGKPNLAASGFASGIIREPLQGVDMTCPVTADTVMAVISPGRVIDALVAISELDPDALGADRTLLLPGLPMAMQEAVDAVAQEAAEHDVVGALGAVTFSPEQDIQRIVDSWPASITSARAEDLGFVGDSSVAAIVRQHIVDVLGE